MSHDQYFNHYGLEKNPFSEVTHEKEFFEIPELEHRIELIKHLIEFSDRIIVVLGEEGSGKTTLFSHLAITRDSKWHLCRLSFNDINTVDDFFKQIFIDQQLEYREMESYASKVSVLHDAFEEMQIKGYIPVLFIDDAHYLSIEILKLLFELAITKNNKPALHIVLFSETNIAELINHRNLGFIHTVEMPLFNEEQISMYIAHRLTTAGYQGDDAISQKQIRSIHKTSNGLPGLINDLATKALQDPAIQTNSNGWLERLYAYALNPKITLPIALILVAGFIVYTLQTEIDEKEKKFQTKQITLPQEKIIDQSEQDSDDEQLDQDYVIQEDNISKTKIEEPEIVLLNKQGDVIYEQDTKTKNSDRNELNISKNNTTQEKTNQQGEAADLSDTTEESVTKLKSIALNDKPVEQITAEKLTPPKKIIEDEIVSTASFEKKIKSEPKSAEPSIETAKSSPIEIQSAKNTEQAIRGADWLEQQPPDHYVLQLMGAYDDGAMNKFIAQNITNKQQLAKFTTLNQNKTWFVLVYGKYASRDQAVAAVSSLPTVLRELKPWPRKIETIQRDLR